MVGAVYESVYCEFKISLEICKISKEKYYKNYNMENNYNDNKCCSSFDFSKDYCKFNR